MLRSVIARIQSIKAFPLLIRALNIEFIASLCYKYSRAHTIRIFELYNLKISWANITVQIEMKTVKRNEVFITSEGFTFVVLGRDQ